MKNILICSDGSAYSEVCCRYGAWLATTNGAAARVLYVTDTRQMEAPFFADISGSLGIQPYGALVDQMREIEDEKARIIREMAERVFSDAGAEPPEFHHETGFLADAIEDFVGEADAVLLGKRGENADFAKAHLGSSLERVVRGIEKPCLVTPRQYIDVSRAAIAYDGGPSCRKAVEFLKANPAFGSLEMHVVTVVEDGDEGRASDLLSEAESALREAGVDARCQMLHGEVERAIADYVRSEDVHCLLAGAYGHSRIRDLLIGSTTTELLRSCRVPVLCFR